MWSKNIPSCHVLRYDCHTLMVTHATCRVTFDLDLYGSHVLSCLGQSFSVLCCGLCERLDRLRFKPLY